MSLDFRILLAHLMNENRQQFINKRFGKLQECVAVTHCAAKDTADDVACAVVRRQLTIGDGETDSAEVVSDDAHSDVRLFVFTIFYSRKLRYLINNRCEHVCVVVRFLALHHSDKAFEAHTCVDMLCRKVNEATVSEAVILHEHKVPNLNHFRIVFIDEVATVDFLASFFVADVDMNL